MLINGEQVKPFSIDDIWPAIAGQIHELEIFNGGLDKLNSDQLCNFCCNNCQCIFSRVEAASGCKQGTDITESFIRRVMHDGNELVACQ
ncbi:hypothetical protein A3780_04975 [Kosakonia radicincitans]|nr:hypothetical protein A3780_04975 [Kosakonia radicincitans]